MASPTILKSGLLLFGFLTLSSCIATPKSGDATLAFYRQKSAGLTTATTGIGAFTDTFYAFARQNCVSCHGNAQAPLFAVSDVNSAYSAAKDASYVSFTSVSSSKLAIYSGNGHCGAPGCEGNTTVATANIQAWAEVENAVATTGGTGSGNGGVVGGGPTTGGANAGALISTAMAVPANLPTGITYVPMRWPLSQLTPSSALLNGAIFELEVQKLSSTTYRVRNPKIAGLTTSVRVTGVHVFVKPSTDAGIGVEDIGAGSVWGSDVVTVPPTTLPGTLPATSLSTTTFVPLDSFSMIIGIRSNQDSFTISLDAVQAAVALTPTFASISSNVLVPKCVNCHNPANKSAGLSYATYSDTLASVSSGNPAASSFYTSVTGTTPNMPIGSLKLTTGETGAISTWITNGALNN